MEETTAGVNEFAESTAEQTDVVETGANTTDATDATETQQSINAGTEADGTGVDGTETEGNEGTDTTEVQSAEDNAKYAAARRQAEREYRQSIDRQNAEIKRRFGQYKNPITGKQVETLEDYLQALDAQEQKKTERMLKEKGVDPDIINQMIENNPLVREAQFMKEQYEVSAAQAKLDEDLKQITKIDPSIKTIDDLVNSEGYEQVFNYVKNNGLNIVDAFKLANSSKLAEKQAAAAKQATINSAKSKSHLETTRGVAGAKTNNYVAIPNSVLERWKDAYPGLTIEQLTAKYNANL